MEHQFHCKEKSGSGRVLENIELVVSWNINSIAKKRAEAEEFLRISNSNILCLQETRRETKHWPTRFHGFQVFESLADNDGEHHRGLAIIIHKGLVAYEVESSPYSIGIKIMDSDECLSTIPTGGD